MAGETILVVDVGKDIDERMNAALEAEGYLTYIVSSQDVNDQMADLLKPSLIYIKPPDLRPTGLDSCKAIHGIPLLMSVPIVLLADLKKPPGPQYREEYGIVDFLEPTFTTEELIQKTATILGKALFSEHPKVEEPVTSRAVKGTEKKRSDHLRPAIGILAILVIAGAAYVAYQQFMPHQKGTPPAVKTPLRAPSAAPKAGLTPQLPPASNVAGTPANTSATTPVPNSETIPVTAPAKNPAAASSSAASAVQAPSASSESASQASPLPFYSVQLGAFRDEQMAAALTKKFKEKGYDAFTQPGVTKDRSRIYRVLVNKYEDRKAAQKMAGEIQVKEQVKTTLYTER